MTPITIDDAIQIARQHHQAGRPAEAVRIYREILARHPDHAEAYNNLGIALVTTGQLDEVIDSFRNAVRRKPDYAEAHSTLGNALKDKGQLNEAIGLAMAHSNLGNALTDAGQLDEAIAACRQAIRIQPDLIEAHNNLGNVLKDTGQIEEAVTSFREALRLRPDLANVHSNLIHTLHFHPGYDARMIYEENRRWNRQHADPLKKFIQPHTDNRDPERQLRIGYVSPDFRAHPIGRFLLSLLAAHDPDHFAIFCYSDVRSPDRFTELLRRHASQWRDTFGLTDERLAQLIRQDQIDILVDLTMHMANNRMLLFARKPAPVQATYLAYCSTTGLDTIEYRLTDPYLDPPGTTNDAFYSEKSIRLTETYWCYPLDDQSPPVVPPPALTAGQVTFGCLNNFCKVSPDALEVWAQLLRATPKSRLVLHAHPGGHRRRVGDFLESRGIDPGRLDFVDRVPMSEYFTEYQQIDIALDSFPYSGGTTTCDAIWMGLPVVTLAGQKAVGRGGVSILANIGASELIANTPQQYVQIATGLASDLPRLAELRRTLRARMQASPLMDAPRFARTIEAAYRQMWRNWCAGQGNPVLQGPVE
jgi:predicted O-linked N-acetylglucosamine transferase (SPINDLY family)